MTKLDHPKPTFKVTPKIRTDALGNARLARTRETYSDAESPELPSVTTKDTQGSAS